MLEHLVSHGVSPERRRLFVIDGSRPATAINAVFGAETPVQRCRNHKLRNVLRRYPPAASADCFVMRAAWR